ncbi:methyltransferase domain-containing protein [Gluconacetobacter azotocaptans]|uniref:Methyltransferase domain-containing protein n=1 Tax=Gluconacetobacter azotocaptans TaxID=142834 RepID=A0A7W4JRL9_9PROT|nr:SAM-dependent methyltransferase [Gluconacetobacter azotocaptans]MBB2189485.1 methyltransferase domain-containing protein [Gluconacetobacter azotocaptans]GBQ34794.1 SAM-dependent methyltransferase [Gluconacetobacter azotocaptans DSM 13594]
MSSETWPGSVFARLYDGHPDPWGFETRDYERRKYARTLAVLGGRRFDFALELGCSIGVMTAELAPYCSRLLGVDVAEAALLRARARCRGWPGVSFHQGHLPGAFPALPPGSCDLIVVSEFLYFLSRADIGGLAERVLTVRRSDAAILLVNWTGPTDTPCTGDEAADLFVRQCCGAGMNGAFSERQDGYRIDLLAGDIKAG